MMRDSSRRTFPRVIKFFVLAYVAGSLFYLTTHLFLITKGNNPHDFVSKHIAPRANTDSSKTSQAQQHYLGLQRVTWTNGDGSRYESMPEDFMLSKVFSDAMGPSKVIPYYLKATHDDDDPDQVAISTLVTHNRFKVLGRLASHYKGPISAAIHVNDDESKQTILTDLHRLYDQNQDMRRYVDIHLIVDKFDRQFNMWRNVAKFFARSEYIIMLDVDFYICTDFRRSLRQHPALMDVLRSGRGAVVVPAFEYIKEDDGEDWRLFPRTKQDLMTAVHKSKIDMFHRSWKRGHGSTNYTKWYTANEPYKVTDYNYSYEPYVIFKKEGSPWCDERFIGYGANKAACLYEIYLAGMDYWVLPDDFLIHQTHHYPEVTRAKERKYNKKLYDHYREEACLRYARMLIAAGEWNTDKASNVKRECGKIKGFKDIISKVN